MSGIVSSIVYAGLLQVGLSRRTTILSLLVIPLTYAMSVWILLKMPTKQHDSSLSPSDHKRYSDIPQQLATSKLRMRINEPIRARGI